MTKEQQDLSRFAAFNLNDLLAEINSNHTTKKEVTAYLDREFIINTINEHNKEILVNKPDFSKETQIDFSEYNFTGTDFRSIPRKDLELFNFNNCDISGSHLDRISLEFFREYMLTGNIVFQGISLEKAYLGPTLTRRIELGIACYICLNLSNLNLSSTNFNHTDIEGLILENTNITGSTFIGVKNLDPKQFAFTIGFDKAIFFTNKEEDSKLKETIKTYSETLDRASYYSDNSQKQQNNFINHLSNIINILDD